MWSSIFIQSNICIYASSSLSCGHFICHRAQDIFRHLSSKFDALNATTWCVCLQIIQKYPGEQCWTIIERNTAKSIRQKTTIPIYQWASYGRIYIWIVQIISNPDSEPVVGSSDARVANQAFTRRWRICWSPNTYGCTYMYTSIKLKYAP